jgi:hypothetical protein
MTHPLIPEACPPGEGTKLIAGRNALDLLPETTEGSRTATDSDRVSPDGRKPCRNSSASVPAHFQL